MPLLFLGAERANVGGDEIGMNKEPGSARADAPEFFEDDDVEQIVQPETSVFLGYGAA